MFFSFLIGASIGTDTKLEEGDKVHRHILNGDAVLFKIQ